MSLQIYQRSGKYRPTVEDGIELSQIEMLHPGGKALTRRTAEVAGLKPGLQVLEVSSGRGTQSIFFAKEFGATITGIDISPEMVRVARARVERENLEALISIDQGDSQALPYADQRFDVVINECAVGIPESPKKVLAEMVRVAKPGARIVIHESTWLQAMPASEKNELAERYGTTPLERDEWVSLLTDAGIRVDTVELDPWSRPEMFWSIREDRQPRNFREILTLPERMSAMTRIYRGFGLKGLRNIQKNERVFRDYVLSQKLGYGIYAGFKA